LPPAALHFLAGLCAAAGINMLTSVATEPGPGAARIIVDSALWIVGAALLTTMATIKANAEAAADRAHNPRLSPAENRDGREEILAGPRVRAGAFGVASALVLAAAVLLVPNVIGGGPAPAPGPSGSSSPVRGR
jgi:hypothetical protein